MRILFLINNLGSGGAQRQMITVATSLHCNNKQVEVLCYDEDDFFLPMLDTFDIKVHWLLYKNPLIRILKVRSFIRNHNYDVVISFLDVPDLLNCLSAVGKHSWKVITSERSAKEKKFKTLKHRIIAWFKGYSNFIVCNSENAKNMWLRYYPQYEKKMKVIYNLVDLSNFSNISDYKLRRANKTHFIIAASYQSIKNPLRMIEAINMLNKEEKEKIIVDWYGKQFVAGDGLSIFESARKKIDEYKLHDIVFLHGETSKIHSSMYEADVIALFSEFEGLPNAICEGMTLGKPIIMTKVSDYDVLVDNTNGVICQWDDVISIKNGFSKIISCSNEDIINMGKASKKRAISLFSKEVILKEWEKILQL